MNGKRAFSWVGVLASLAGALGAAGADRVGQPRDGAGVVVPTQQLIRPAGRSVEFAGRPVDVAVAPGGRFVYAKDNRGLVVIDADRWAVVQELKFPVDGTSMHGLVLTRDGRRMYATGSRAILWEGEVGADGKVRQVRPIGTATAAAAAAGAAPATKPAAVKPTYPCGLALSKDEKTAYVCLSTRNALAVIDLDARRPVAEIPVGVAPFAVALAPDGNTAYVSNWGGRHPQPGEHTAKSAGTPTLVDERGIAASGTVGFVDLRQRRETTEVAVGLHPAGLALSADGRSLYVANANSDTVSVLDTGANPRVRETIPVRPDPALPFGSASNALALAPDGKTLYVANGGNNAVAVVELGQGQQPSRLAGFIPAGWYPGAVALDGNRLVIANVKGVGSRDAARVKDGGWNTHYHRGTVTRVDVPDAAMLAKYTEQVRADARVPEALAAAERAPQAGAAAVPVPRRAGEPSVFEHVVYVIKENRTYDQVFGDIEAGNGDPKLCIFGRNVTPNQHALAEQFVLLDNFYCNGVLSADGHQWAVEGNVADGVEKSFGGWTRSYPFPGDDPLAFVSSGFIWDDALLHNLTFRNYGEMGLAAPVPANATFTQIYQDHLNQTGKVKFKLTTAIDELRRYTHPGYPGWNLLIPDAVRIDIFLKELRQFEQNGNLPNLTIVFLPSDHTRGTAPGAPTPAAMVADNDLAVGKLVDAISHSKFWPKTAVFVIEDDPQAGFDHVDGHRSTCLVVSPYTKRGQTVGAFYNQTSVLHTMELILGLPPMNQMDAMAPVMRECFGEQANLEPFTALPNQIPLDQMNPPANRLRGAAREWAEKSLAQRADKPDLMDEDTLNRVLWFAMKGESEPYPAAYAGAHGKGLAKLGLKLDGRRHKDDDDDDDDD